MFDSCFIAIQYCASQKETLVDIYIYIEYHLQIQVCRDGGDGREIRKGKEMSE